MGAKWKKTVSLNACDKAIGMLREAEEIMEFAAAWDAKEYGPIQGDQAAFSNMESYIRVARVACEDMVNLINEGRHKD